MSPHDLPAVLPASVTVSFPSAGGGADHAVEVTLASLALPELAGVGTHAGSKVFHATCVADGSPGNGDELDALAAQIAADWYLAQTARLDLVLVGVPAWTLTGLEDQALYSHDRDGIRLRVSRGPFDDPHEELYYHGSAGSYGRSGPYLPLDGGTLTGDLVVDGDVILSAGGVSASALTVVSGLSPSLTLSLYDSLAVLQNSLTLTALGLSLNVGVFYAPVIYPQRVRKYHATYEFSDDEVALTPLDAFWWRVTLTDDWTLDGIDATGAVDGDWYEITNAGGGLLTVPNESGLAASGDRLFTCDGLDSSLDEGETAYVQYDGDLGGWRFLKFCCGDGGGGAVTYQMSIDSDSSGLKLVNDEESPGDNFHYGTDGAGVKGWIADPDLSGYPHWETITKSYTDFAVGSATNDIEIYSLPAGWCCHAAVMIPTVAFSGPGIMTYTMSLGVTSTAYADYIASNSMTFSPSDTNFFTSGAVFKFHNLGSPTSVRAKVGSVGANLDAATAGSVTFLLQVSKVVP